MEENRKLPEIITQEDLSRYEHYLTVGKLREAIKDMPDDGLVLVQRVEDVYYEKHHWGLVLKEGEHYHWAKKWNEDLDSGEYEDKEKYPNATPEKWRPNTAEEMELSKEQYHPAWCAVTYKDDQKNLYIDLHY